MINKRRYEKQKLEKELERLKTDVRSLVTGIDWYIIWRLLIIMYVKKEEKDFTNTGKEAEKLNF